MPSNEHIPSAFRRWWLKAWELFGGSATAVAGLETGTPNADDLISYVEVTPAEAAEGTYTVGVNPTEDDTIGFNGFEFTFKDSGVEDDEITIGTGATGSDTNLGITIDNLITALNGSADALLSGATYSDNHTSTNKDATVVTVTHDTPGAAGNAYTLDTDTANITPSAATLEGGSDIVNVLKATTVEDLATAIDGILNP